VRNQKHIFWKTKGNILTNNNKTNIIRMKKNERGKGTHIFADTKQHYELLDGLRGVAALLVVYYHVHEGFAFASGAPVIERFNHGYLAVDFFFILSGFVISYAYDDRWNKTLTTANFFRRRLIRLHPMVVMGAVIGLVSFLASGSERWDGTHAATSATMLALLCMMFFIPALPRMARDVRGNGEMFPLNGPSWSLFFEYIGNILYAFFLRRLSTGGLKVLVALLAVAYIVFAVGNVSGYGNIGVGWTLDTVNFFGGLLRMLFPFSLGMLVARSFRKRGVHGAFWICSLLLLVLFAVPYLTADGLGQMSLNGMYEVVCVGVFFPFIVWLGASGTTTDRRSTAICKFLGDSSYPLYIVHYPLMYLFYMWMIKQKVYTLDATWHIALLVCASSVVLAYLCLRLYDIPLRRYLTKTFMKKQPNSDPNDRTRA